MERKTVTKETRRKERTAISEPGSVDPDDLKRLVRDGLTTMTQAERESFILALERELRASHQCMRLYLFPLGISANIPQDLTPGDIGHLIRFLKMSVPGARQVVDRVAELFAVDLKDEAAPKPGDLTGGLGPEERGDWFMPRCRPLRPITRG
jgi:hypothetical protein